MAGRIVRIGVLALQGDYREHLIMLKRCGVRGVPVKSPAGLLDIDGLIIPGGESTTIGRLLETYGMVDVLRETAEKGLPVFGTCAGMVLMSRELAGENGVNLAVMDTVVRRNAFGRQVDSFETELRIDSIAHSEDPFHAIFIRAPIVEEVGRDTSVMARNGDDIVMVRQGDTVACSFHPELTDDARVHEFFLQLVKKREPLSLEGD